MNPHPTFGEWLLVAAGGMLCAVAMLALLVAPVHG